MLLLCVSAAQCKIHKGDGLCEKYKKMYHYVQVAKANIKDTTRKIFYGPTLSLKNIYLSECRQETVVSDVSG